MCSALSCVKLFSDKPQTSLSRGLLVFLSLDIILLHFLEGIRRVNGSTSLAYLLIRFKKITVRIKRIRKKVGQLAL